MERFDRSWGFDTYQAKGGGVVWVCWPCYWKGTRSTKADKKPGITILFSWREFFILWFSISLLICLILEKEAAKGGWRLALILWIAASIAIMFSVRRKN